MDTVLPANSDTFVTRAVLNEVIQLEIKSFLHTENGGFLVEDHSASGVPAVLPGIVSVFGGAVTDVEGHDRESLRRLVILA